MTTICLTMIVRNEEQVVDRCLESVLPYVDAWLVVDTGSTDETRERVRSALAGLPGDVVDRPWRNFAHNRNEALDLARDQADYLLTIDADEVLHTEPGFVMPDLIADGYRVRHRSEGTSNTFLLPQIVRSGSAWRWEGVVHEALICDEPRTMEVLGGLEIVGHFDGARNTDPTAKYLADAALLEEAVAEDPDNARAWFYLAQSWRDAGQPVKAISCYRHRVELGGWGEEVWYALFQVAVLVERIGGDRAMVADAYLDAWEYRPQRAESLCELARYHRVNGDHHRAWLAARHAAAVQRPGTETLFLEESVYAWRSSEELMLACLNTGRLDDARKTWTALIEGEELPEEERPRVLANRRFLWTEADA